MYYLSLQTALEVLNLDQASFFLIQFQYQIRQHHPRTETFQKLIISVRLSEKAITAKLVRVSHKFLLVFLIYRCLKNYMLYLELFQRRKTLLHLSNEPVAHKIRRGVFLVVSCFDIKKKN